MNENKFELVKRLFTGAILQGLNPRIRQTLAILIILSDDKNIVDISLSRIAKILNNSRETAIIYFNVLKSKNYITKGGGQTDTLWDVSPFMEGIR